MSSSAQPTNREPLQGRPWSDRSASTWRICSSAPLPPAQGFVQSAPTPLEPDISSYRRLSHPGITWALHFSRKKKNQVTMETRSFSEQPFQPSPHPSLLLWSALSAHSPPPARHPASYNPKPGLRGHLPATQKLAKSSWDSSTCLLTLLHHPEPGVSEHQVLEAQLR